MRITAFVAALVLLLGCKPSPTTTEVRPLAVLVHGAWMGASAWRQTSAELTKLGYEVRTLDLPGHGADTTPPDSLSLDSYTQAVIAAMDQRSEVVLVGHSMAGMVISAVAERVPHRIKRLVYVAAYLPRSDESLYQLAQLDSASLVGKYWRQADPKAYSPAWIDSLGRVEVFCADCPDSLKAALIREHRAEAVPPLATPVTLTDSAFGRVPKAYIETTLDRAVSHSLQQRMLQHTPVARRVQLATSHCPFYTQPAELARAIATQN